MITRIDPRDRQDIRAKSEYLSRDIVIESRYHGNHRDDGHDANDNAEESQQGSQTVRA